MEKIMEVKVHGYTLHGDYYLADKVITNVDWEEALRMERVVALPNGKTVVAYTLSKAELETIPKEERKCGNWYWTSITYDGERHWYVNGGGGFGIGSDGIDDDNGGARLGFKNPF